MKYDIGAVQLMKEQGGSFTSTLAELWFKADMGNRTKLEEAFCHYFNQYQGQYDSLIGRQWEPDAVELEEGFVGIFN